MISPEHADLVQSLEQGIVSHLLKPHVYLATTCLWVPLRCQLRPNASLELLDRFLPHLVQFCDFILQGLVVVIRHLQDANRICHDDFLQLFVEIPRNTLSQVNSSWQGVEVSLPDPLECGEDLLDGSGDLLDVESIQQLLDWDIFQDLVVVPCRLQSLVDVGVMLELYDSAVLFGAI